ncbi:MAG: fluoride efflux transporter CrcB [Myxococcales bacterium]|nr:fluoride efflux transporter CrcB [Myxococcales bacterium]
MLKLILMVGLGGFIGATLRYGVAEGVQKLTQTDDFPWGILAANLIGCLVIGLLARLGELHEIFTPQTRALIFTGVLGSFTTFSTFSSDSLGLFQEGRPQAALANVLVQVVAGLGMVWLGQLIGGLFERGA